LGGIEEGTQLKKGDTGEEKEKAQKGRDRGGRGGGLQGS